MFKRTENPSLIRRGMTLATVAALAVTAFEVPAVQAGIDAPVAQEAAPAAAGPATDFSARRRYARRGYRNDAAGLAFMGLALGTVGAVIANQQRRDYYRQRYYYGGNPYYGGYYYGQPGYYGGGPYYGY